MLCQECNVKPYKCNVQTKAKIDASRYWCVSEVHKGVCAGASTIVLKPAEYVHDHRFPARRDKPSKQAAKILWALLALKLRTCMQMCACSQQVCRAAKCYNAYTTRGSIPGISQAAIAAALAFRSLPLLLNMKVCKGLI